MNNIMLVGRLNKEIKEKRENNKTYLLIELSVPRSFANEDGVYENDIIMTKLSKSNDYELTSYIKVGDVVGIRGRLENHNNKYNVIVDKLTFLSSKSDADADPTNNY